MRLLIAVLAVIATICRADVYMHNPRGSNDRNCERNVNRNNGNRLFDSQNNNNGGYACPRSVGDEGFQAENGTATFAAVNPETGRVTKFTQNKRMYYYSGSILPIEWTNQHGCGGNSKVNCEIILQYACEDTLDPAVDNFWPWVSNKNSKSSAYYGKQHFRYKYNIAAPRDGVPIDSNDAATDTIGDDEASAIPSTPNTRRYGMHENFDYYAACQHTERNNGLYTADQRINRLDQRGTRQNPNGNRHGLECPEERDYYPWWHPSPWIDIAVLTDSAGDEVCYPNDTNGTCTTRCAYYMNNTMNWNKKGYCDVHHNITANNVNMKLNNAMWTQRRWYNHKEACEAPSNKGMFKWYEVSHADNLNFASNSFVCAHTQYSRTNQLGNARGDAVVSQSEFESKGIVKNSVSEGVNANRFLWTIPAIPTAKNHSYFPSGMASAYQSCTLRMRYNVSSADFQSWPREAVAHGTPRMVDHFNNSRFRGDTRTPLRQDEYVYIGPGDNDYSGDMFVKLKVNTNQYARTFQDRSYVFSIKPVPTTSMTSDVTVNEADTPKVNADAIRTALQSGGKIYNVNVRGKRGNIVQVYPSVEYDFVPDALALNENDMVHFQWTGSDYNPRRGCNDATGGPPDLNTYYTDANANQNPRADRSNVVFTYHMGNNVPMDYIGYSAQHTNLSYIEKLATANWTVLQNVPCYDPTDPHQTHANAQWCYEQVMRLAYLNQQSDSGSLVLRQGRQCLTQSELDAILNQDVADFHPLNCAKLNAKPYSYFDGGVMVMKKQGWFPFYSSRNNNFSNRQQIAVICVGKNCTVNADSSVLEDTNPMTDAHSGLGKVTHAAAASACFDTASSANGANANGAHTCLPTVETPLTPETAIQSQSFAVQEGDNDNKGDGNPKGCATLSFTYDSSSVEDNVALAIGLLFVGLFCSWLAYYLYNRYQARQAGVSKFRYETAWQKATAIDRDGRSNSSSFSFANPGVKLARPVKRADPGVATSSGNTTPVGADSAATAASPGPAGVESVPSSAPSSGPSSPTPLLSANSVRASSPQRPAGPARAATTSASRAMAVKSMGGTRPATNSKVNKRYEMI